MTFLTLLQVIRFIDDNILLQRPGPCPATIYHVMLGCWRRDSNDRFTFKRIYHVLVDYGRKMMKCYHKHNLQNVAEYDEVWTGPGKLLSCQRSRRLPPVASPAGRYVIRVAFHQ